ncbi:MAG TPA: cobalamin biosynthesis protein CbiX [Gammaproteobacteria bacterium]|nr:cobalamin biosynthesis protein CbiX [Gammaproteobacteria bacterium]
MISEQHEAVLLIVAHGSRRQASNDQIRKLAIALSTCNNPAYCQVVAAFLELEAPSITAAIAQHVLQGARNIVVLPYFLAKGRHVEEDIPAQIRMSRTQFPEVTITLAAHLGAATEMTDLIFTHLQPRCCSKGDQK